MKTRKVFMTSILTIIAIVSLTFLIGFKDRPKSTLRMEGIINVAHRGASSYAPENTMAAFRTAVEQGADFIECDVHLSKDNELIIMHDTKVNRTTNGVGRIKDLTLDQIKELDAGSKFSSDFAGEKVITLHELLEEFKDEVGIIIEIKSPSLYPGIEELVVQAIQEAKAEQVIIQSFDMDSLKKVHQLLPEIPIAALISRANHPLSEKKLNEISAFATYVNYNIKYLNKYIVSQIHQKDKKIMAWTIYDHRNMNKAQKLGVDGIITSYPDWLIGEEPLLAKDE